MTCTWALFCFRRKIQWSTWKKDHPPNRQNPGGCFERLFWRLYNEGWNSSDRCRSRGRVETAVIKYCARLQLFFAFGNKFKFELCCWCFMFVDSNRGYLGFAFLHRMSTAVPLFSSIKSDILRCTNVRPGSHSKRILSLRSLLGQFVRWEAVPRA